MSGRIAEMVAQRMNARVLPEGCEGGFWTATLSPADLPRCDGCEKLQRGAVVTCDIGGGVIVLCLDCALLDCMGVKS